MDSRSKHDRSRFNQKWTHPPRSMFSRSLVVSQPLAGTKNRYRYSIVIPVLEPPPVLETRTGTAIATVPDSSIGIEDTLGHRNTAHALTLHPTGGEALRCRIRRSPTRPTARTVGPPIVLAIRL